MSTLAFVDIETTGLDPDRHEIWEIAIVVLGDRPSEQVWQLPVDLAWADPGALRVNRYYERRAPKAHAPRTTAGVVARLLDGIAFCAANPAFDAAFVERWLRANGQCPTWHYSLVDVKSMAGGRLGIAPPFGSTADLTRLLGINPDDFSRHTALGDARMAAAMYEACLR